MEQNLLQKLQRVKIKDILSIFLFLLALPISFFYKKKRTHLWLICDSEKEGRDNGYWLFKYIKENQPSQDVAFALSPKSPDYERVSKVGEVVPFGSFKHWLYYLSATINISSQKEGKPNAAVCYVLEVYGLRKNTRVFLQHGIIKDEMEFLHYEHTKMRLFVCTTKKETEFVANTYGYPKGWVQQLGLARFDNLKDESQGKGQILFMPTWRNWIGVKTYQSGKYDDVSSFDHTDFFRYWNDLIHNERLQRLLEEKDLKLVFYPHRKMQEFLEDFSIQNKRIRLGSWTKDDVQDLLKESSVLVTDYSSIAMDFAYMKKPLVYFQFDYEKFREGHYSEGYFSYEKDGFGPVVYDVDQAVDELEKIMDNNYQMASDYRQKADEFFGENDYKNCERNYKAILALDV
ncbi:MAG: CDP-glycerol glycerophosphotransferase family protein [Lachnospiraceae bacterium]|nr:CDP-glycerol glycerophosphotransferase family protein [Lachnospiraceae bacterium]